LSEKSRGKGADDSLIPRHGGYRKLKSFQVAQLVYDVTVRFCRRYVSRSSRTRDQMVQAARSGTQNIAEGSMAAGTSKKMELKLTNVARASLEELKLDYEDFLRHRRLGRWSEDDPRRAALVARRAKNADEVAEWIVEVHGRDGRDGRDGQYGLDGLDGLDGHGSNPDYAGPSANAALVLTEVAISLLQRQIASLARAFEEEGGFTERLYRTRRERRRGGRHGQDGRGGQDGRHGRSGQ